VHTGSIPVGAFLDVRRAGADIVGAGAAACLRRSTDASDKRVGVA